MTHGKNENFMQDDPKQRLEDEEKEEARKRKLELAPITLKLGIFEGELHELKIKLGEVHDALNGLVSERGALSRLDVVEEKQKTLTAELRALNSEIEKFKLVDYTSIIVRATDIMGRLETKLDRT
jgi:hypothetical protein